VVEELFNHSRWCRSDCGRRGFEKELPVVIAAARRVRSRSGADAGASDSDILAGAAILAMTGWWGLGRVFHGLI